MGREEVFVGVAILVHDGFSMAETLKPLLSEAGIATCSHEGGKSLLEAGLPDGPTCVVLDLQLPGQDGLHIQRALRAIDPGLPIIFLSGSADVPSVVTALKNGALDFLEKGRFRPEELVSRVVSALEGHRRYLDRKEHQEALQAKVRELTPRERQVALSAARGKPNKMIASELGISERTVEIHRGNAMHKLGLRSVTDLTRLFAKFDAIELRAARAPANGSRPGGPADGGFLGESP